MLGGIRHALFVCFLHARKDQMALQISLSGAQTIHCIPVRAIEGENVVTRSAKIS
mgnify:CR=1 FL=1